MKLGVIGFGIMGERLTRAALAQQGRGVTLSGVWDPSDAAMARLRSDLPSVPVLDSAETLIADSDCVYIASPPESHLLHARTALAAGKAVFCEKPLAVDDADAVAFAREAKGARAAVNFVFASSPAVAQLRVWIAEGMVGPVERLEIEMGFAEWPRPWQHDAVSWLGKRRQGGFTREVASHFLFLTRRLLGPMVLQSASTTYPDGDGSETAVEATLTAGGVPVRIAGGVGNTEESDRNRWVLTGRDGAVRLCDWSRAQRLGVDGVWQEAPDAMPLEAARPLILKGQLEKLAALTAGDAAPDFPLASVEEALEVQQIVEAVLAV